MAPTGSGGAAYASDQLTASVFHLQVGGCELSASAVALEVERDRLAFEQLAQPRPLHDRAAHEHVFAARLDWLFNGT